MVYKNWFNVDTELTVKVTHFDKNVGYVEFKLYKDGVFLQDALWYDLFYDAVLEDVVNMTEKVIDITDYQIRM